MPLLTDDQRQGLAELYESNRVEVSRLCRRILNDPEEAADACHEVFIRAANEFAAGTLPTSPRMWLLTVARNHCLDLLRRRKRLWKALNAIGDIPDVPANPEVAVIGRQNVDSLLRKLSPRERTALWQSAIENKPIAEIATGLRLTYLAAAQVLSRARRHAALAAANVASILGLLRLHRMGRGGRHAPTAALVSAVQLVVLVGLPLVVPSIQSSSTPHGPYPLRPQPARLASPSTAAGDLLEGISLGIRLPAVMDQLSGQRLPVLPVGAPLPVQSVATSTFHQLSSLLGDIRSGLPAPPAVPPSPSVGPPPKVP